MTTLANYWAGQGHRVDLLTTHDNGHPPHYELDQRVHLQSVDPKRHGPAKQFAIVRSLHNEIARAKPDVVVSFLNYTNILTLAACRGLACPVIVSERLDPRVIDIGPIWSLARHLTYRRASYLVAQTATAASLYEHLAPGRVRVIPNPVVARGGEMGPLAAWGNAERPTILAVGRLAHQKGYDIAFRALKLLPLEYASWRLVVLGEGPLRQELESLRDTLGLQDRVVLAGSVPDTWPWLKRAQIFLMASRSEGFPNALCEAMAAGMPVLSTDCPSGPADIIDHDVNGLLAPTEDPVALAAALQRLISSPDLRERLAAAAPAVAQRYSQISVLAQWDELVNRVAGDQSPRNDSQTETEAN